MNAKTQTAQSDVTDATAQSVEKRLKEVEDYASQLDEALGAALDRIEALEKAKPVAGKADKGLAARVEALEATKPETDSMGLPKVV